jgi:hypothetical protein
MAQIEARFMGEFRIPLFWDPTFRAPETSVRNYHYTLIISQKSADLKQRFKLAWQLEVCCLNKK